MTHAARDSTRANARPRVGFSEYPQNLAAGGAITPLALERFDWSRPRCALSEAHAAFLRHLSRSTPPASAPCYSSPP
jgi:hypothetical protein